MLKLFLVNLLNVSFIRKKKEEKNTKFIILERFDSTCLTMVTNVKRKNHHITKSPHVVSY